MSTSANTGVRLRCLKLQLQSGGFSRISECVRVTTVCYVIAIAVILCLNGITAVADEGAAQHDDDYTVSEDNDNDNQEENYGKGNYLIPPVASESVQPVLLHERDVIRLVDYRQQFLLIGDGTHANVSLAQMRGKSANEFVVVKSFKDASFSHIMLESRIHRYVEDLNVSPRLIGLLPAGDLSCNISMVFEYVPYSKSLYDFMRSTPNQDSMQEWLSLCAQIARIFRLIHSYDVIFNDLHRSNIVVQKISERVSKAFLIDFGFATYKKGKFYSNSYGSLEAYDFISPEAKRNGITVKASDVYSIGHVLSRFAAKLEIPQLWRLADWCQARNPEDRPKPEDIERELEKIRLEQWLISVPGTWPGKSVISLKSIFSTSVDGFSSEYKMCGLRSSIQQEGQTPDGDVAESTIDNRSPKVEAESSVLMWLMGDEFEIYDRCPVTLFVLDTHEVMFRQERIRLRRSSSNSIYLTFLKSTKTSVIVKQFHDVSFGKIRQEVCVTARLGKLGVAPRVLGILPGPGETPLDDAAFVQEYYGIGLTLDEFRIRVESVDFGYDVLRRAATEEKFTSEDSFSSTTTNSDNSTGFRYNLADLFRQATDTGSNSCDIAPHTLQILEKAALRLAQIVKRTHDVGLLINNLNEHNVLVQWNDTSRGLDVRIIDLNGVSGLQGVITSSSSKYLSRFAYLAPEVVMGGTSSKASDTYSLCHVVHKLLSKYIAKNSLKIHNLKKSIQDRSECNDTKDNLSQKSKYNGKSRTRPECKFDTRKRLDLLLDLSSFRLYRLTVVLSKCLGNSLESRPSLQEIVGVLKSL